MPTLRSSSAAVPRSSAVDEEQLDDVLPRILKLRHLDLQGVHVFAATGVLESSLLVEYTRHVFDLVQRLERDYRRRFPVVDLGGGLGVDYRTFPGRDLDLAHYASSLRDLIAAFGFGDKEIALELGRYLVGEAGTYVVRVLDVKHSRGTGLCPGGRRDESLPAPGSGPAGSSGDVAAPRYRIGVRHRRGCRRPSRPTRHLRHRRTALHLD